MLDAWREAPLYTERERAALAWAESVTLLTEGHVPDEVYERAKKQFTEQELIDLTMVVITINGWNRLNVAFRTEAGTYQPGQSATGKS
jgi:alkylhydroperoxidase family enzyme